MKKYRVKTGNFDRENSWAENSGGDKFTTPPGYDDEMIFDKNTPDNDLHICNGNYYVKSYYFRKDFRGNVKIPVDCSLSFRENASWDAGKTERKNKKIKNNFRQNLPRKWKQWEVV